MTPSPRTSPVDRLDEMVIDDAPRLCALYRGAEPELPAEEQAPAGVAGWVLAWPDGSAVTLLGDEHSWQIVSAPLASVERMWTALLGADLVAVRASAV